MDQRCIKFKRVFLTLLSNFRCCYRIKFNLTKINPNNIFKFNQMKINLSNSGQLFIVLFVLIQNKPSEKVDSKVEYVDLFLSFITLSTYISNVSFFWFILPHYQFTFAMFPVCCSLISIWLNFNELNPLFWNSLN